MSLMRRSSDPEWEDVAPMYVYVASGSNRLTLDRPTPKAFIELSMRALAQSGELDEEELDRCHHALRTRFGLYDDIYE